MSVKVTLGISWSAIDFQWGSWKYPEYDKEYPLKSFSNSSIPHETPSAHNTNFIYNIGLEFEIDLLHCNDHPSSASHSGYNPFVTWMAQTML